MTFMTWTKIADHMKVRKHNMNVGWLGLVQVYLESADGFPSCFRRIRANAAVTLLQSADTPNHQIVIAFYAWSSLRCIRYQPTNHTPQGSIPHNLLGGCSPGSTRARLPQPPSVPTGSASLNDELFKIQCQLWQQMGDTVRRQHT